MRTMDFVFKPRASASCNGDFILLETMSGYRRVKVDPSAPKHLLPMDADEAALGQALLDALKNSRQIEFSHVGAFFDLATVEAEYEQRNKALMAQFGYKTKRALFKNMMKVSIDRDGDKIVLVPMRHHDLEGWGREKDDGIEDVVIPAGSAPAELGAALRLAFTRCE